MLQILYENNLTGEIHGVTTLVTAAVWETKRAGAPASLTLSLRADGDVSWELGGALSLGTAAGTLFYGYVMRISQNERDEVQVTAYDQTRYLKAKDSYVFEGRRADEITREIAEDFGLRLGVLANTGYVIPVLIADGQCLLDILLGALQMTYESTGRLFFLWDDGGALRVTDTQETELDLIVGDGSLATGYTFESDIDTETYNQIKLVKENRRIGARDVYLFEDRESMTRWGVLQSYEKVTEELNEAQMRVRGEALLGLYNRPSRSFALSARADLSVRAGRRLFVNFALLGVDEYVLVEEARHDLLAETMNLKVRVL